MSSIGLVSAITAATLGAIVGAPAPKNSSDAASIDIRFGDKVFTYTDEYITPSDFTVAEEIERRRINAPLPLKMELTDKYLQKGADYKTALSVCFPRLVFAVDEVADYVYIAPVDSRAVYNGGRFVASEDREGRRLDEDRLYGGIYYTLKFSGRGEVAASTVSVAPEVTRAELRKNLALRAEYTTDYSSSKPDRAHNVSFAASKFDGISVPAGGELSFNKTVGKRIAENGFKVAKIIVDGSYVDGIGGGVCQASTAVYNAAIRAGLTARANSHTICPSYCPPGLDAMISSASDLVVVNTTGHDVYFSVKSGGGKTTVKIFGEPAEYEYVPESIVKSTTEPELRELVDREHLYFDATAVQGDRLLASPGRAGFVSETYIKKLKRGKLVSRYKIRENTYYPSPRIVMVAP